MLEQTKFEEKIRRLKPNMRRELEKHVNDLLADSSQSQKRKPVLKWRGAIKGMGQDYNAVTLQHELNKWRSD